MKLKSKVGILSIVYITHEAQESLVKRRNLGRNACYTALVLILSLMPVSAFSHALNTPSIGDDGHLGVYKQSYYYDLQAGSKLADKGDYHQAVPYFRQVVEKNPSNVMAQYNLGYSLMESAQEMTDPVAKAQHLEEAQWAFMRVRDLNPELTLTYYKLGKLALLQDDYQGAVEAYKIGVEYNPENFALWFNLAAAYEKVDDLRQAEHAYKKALEANPRFVYAHNNLGLLYEQTNRIDMAEAVYREALAQVPDYNYARLNLGSLLQTQGRLDEAEDTYREAISYEPDNAWAHLYLGNTFYRKSQYSKALDCYNRAIELNPKYPTTYYLASLALQKLNRPEEALANSLQYINLAPNGAFSQEAGELVMTLQQAKERALNVHKP